MGCENELNKKKDNCDGLLIYDEDMPAYVAIVSSRQQSAMFEQNIPVKSYSTALHT